MRMPHLVRRQHVIRRRIFAGCEGDSEVSYIALVRRIVEDVHQKVYLDAQPLQPGGGDPLALVLGLSGNLVCGAIVTPMEGAYGNQERDPGRFAGGA